MSYQSDTLVREEIKIKHPSMWVVHLHNDDFTPMDFVVELLEEVFSKSADEAELIMLQVHNEGSAKVNRYTREIAETKVAQATALATEYGHPLKVTCQEE